MKRSKKIKIVFLIFLILFCVYFQSVGYSAIFSTMSIRGNAYARVDADTRITGLSVYQVFDDAFSTYDEFNKDNISLGLSLPNSDSYIIYKVDVTNYGDDVGIFNISGLPDYLSYELIDYNLKNKLCDASNNCSYGIISTFYIKIKWNNYNSDEVVHDFSLKFDFRSVYSIDYSGITIKDYPSLIMDKETLNLTFIDDIPNKLNIYVDGSEIPRNSYIYDNNSGNLIFESVTGDLVIEKGESTLIDGREFSAKLKNFVNDSTEYLYNSLDTTVTYIGIFEDEIPAGYTESEFLSLPSTSASDNGRVKIYYDNGKVFIYSIDDILAPVSSYSLFRGYSNLIELNITALDTKNVSDIGAMFQDLTSIEYLDISTFSFSRSVRVFYTFYNDINLKEIKFHSSLKVNNLQHTFSNCQNLEKLDLSNWDVSLADKFSNAFANCYKLSELNLSGWDTSNATDMSFMFRYNQNLTQLDISSFNTSNVTTMERMFGYCSKLEKIYVGDGWDTSNVTFSESMFSNSPLLPNFDSTIVDVTKAYVGDGGYLSYPVKTVMIDNVTYEYEQGMTWEEWVNSEYNTINARVNGEYIYLGSSIATLKYKNAVDKDDVIDGTLTYIFSSSGGAVD